jgi:hypothetical protein
MFLTICLHWHYNNFSLYLYAFPLRLCLWYPHSLLCLPLLFHITSIWSFRSWDSDVESLNGFSISTTGMSSKTLQHSKCSPLRFNSFMPIQCYPLNISLRSPCFFIYQSYLWNYIRYLFYVLLSQDWLENYSLSSFISFYLGLGISSCCIPQIGFYIMAISNTLHNDLN